MNVSWRGVLLIMLLGLVCGCQSRPPSSYAYPFTKIPGPSVDDEIRFYKERLKTRPGSFTDRNYLAGAYLVKAQATFDWGYYALAEKLARESLAMMPTDNHPATLILASVAEGRHDFKQALEMAHSVYDTDARGTEAIGLITSCLLETGRLQEAEPYANRMGSRMPTSSALIVKARLLAAQGQDDRAVQLLKGAIQGEQPQDRRTSARARSLLGEIALRRGQLAQAHDALDQARQVEPRNPVTLADLGRLAEREGELEQAAKYYAEAYDDSRNPALLIQLARVRCVQGQLEEAKRLWSKSEEMLMPEIQKGGFGHARDVARLLMDRGHAEDLAKAESLMEQEVARRHDVITLQMLAEARFRRGMLQPAAEALQQAVATGLADPDLWWHAGKAQEKLGHAEQASQLLEKARSIDPNVQPSPWGN